jgi:AraC-like DNA-binding protein
MKQQTSFTITNLQNGHLSFKLFFFRDTSYFDHVQRLNYYSLIWVQQGEGKIKADFSEYDFSSHSLFAFAPYQPFMLSGNGKLEGVALNFHPDFFCIHKHQHEVACHGILFNNIYQAPFVAVDTPTQSTFGMLIENIRLEMQQPALAQAELLLSYLKIFLITASRLKAQLPPEQKTIIGKAPFILQTLKDAIEAHYKTMHSASEYADLLHISPKALAKLTKAHFNKTLTDLIAERIVIEAKRELYLTNKSVKEIAYQLGYADEYYFSRFFKNNAAVSPQMYRDTVGFARAMA